MNDADKQEFADKMKEMSRALSRIIDSDDIDAYFNQLQDLPLEIVLKGIDHAIRARDPEDPFLTPLISVPEIRGAIDRLSEEEREKHVVAGCEACNQTGWLLTEANKDTYATARPCRCLYLIAKKAAMNKQKPTLKEIKSRKAAEDIVTAYEHFAEKEKKDA